jgi:hypothetical protein
MTLSHGGNDGHTIAVPICESDHPPYHPEYMMWSRADLARGICPWCGSYVGNDPKVAREIRARELIGEEG